MYPWQWESWTSTLSCLSRLQILLLDTPLALSLKLQMALKHDDDDSEDEDEPDSEDDTNSVASDFIEEKSAVALEVENTSYARFVIKY